VIRTVFLFAVVGLSSGACSGPSADVKPWVGEWQHGSWVTLWLLANGEFESEEIPFAESKPSPNVYLKGSWAVGKGILTLHATQGAVVSTYFGRPYHVEKSKVDFQTRLTLDPTRKSMVCHQNHITPPTEPDPRKIAYQLDRVPREPAPDWNALETWPKMRK
jgi:hypothetical protein